MSKIQPAFTKDDITGVECRFAIYCEPPEGVRDDIHLVKEIVHLKDGSKIPNVRLVKNYERPYWITKKGFQNHKQKKEWEHINNVREFKSTQSQLVANAARALEQPWFNGNLRKLARSPFLYGADILSTALIKQMYQDKFPDIITPFSIACFDTETDVVNGTEEVIMATLSFKTKVYTCIQKSYLEGLGHDVAGKLQALLVKYLDEYVQKRKIEWIVEIADDDVGVICNTIKKAHEWQPDFLAIWNMDFDIPKVVESLKKKGVDPAEVFSDPRVPHQYRFFKYKQGPNQKVTASGKVTPIKPAARWHTVFCPSGFYVIDAMCAFRHIRNGEAEKPSYSLDSILNDVLGIRKLKFKEADHVSGLKWHQLMQTEYKLEYVIYNVFDCISMEELDEKTKDLSLSLPMMSGSSDFENFKSQPRRVVDELHRFVIKKQGKVIGTTSDQMSDELDTLTIGLKDWIVMLPAHLVADNGLQCIEEAPDLRTNIRTEVGDLDVAASYPNGECVFNVSKETTARELVSIEGVSEQTRRMQGINLCAGHVNAVEVCVGLFKLPTLDMLLDSFVADNNLSIEGVNVEDAQYINAFIASDEALAKASLAEYDEDES